MRKRNLKSAHFERLKVSLEKGEAREEKRGEKRGEKQENRRGRRGERHLFPFSPTTSRLIEAPFLDPELYHCIKKGHLIIPQFV